MVNGREIEDGWGEDGRRWGEGGGGGKVPEGESYSEADSLWGDDA